MYVYQQISAWHNYRPPLLSLKSIAFKYSIKSIVKLKDLVSRAEMAKSSEELLKGSGRGEHRGELCDIISEFASEPPDTGMLKNKRCCRVYG